MAGNAGGGLGDGDDGMAHLLARHDPGPSCDATRNAPPAGPQTCDGGPAATGQSTAAGQAVATGGGAAKQA